MTAAESLLWASAAQAAKQARDKQLADIVESAGQRPQVGCVHVTAAHTSLLHIFGFAHWDWPPHAYAVMGPAVFQACHYPSISDVSDVAQAGGGQMLRIDLREAAVVQNPTSGGGLGDVAEE